MINDLLKKNVKLTDTVPVLNGDWLKFFHNGPGVIVAVHRTTDGGVFGNPYLVLVRNAGGETREFALAFLILL